MTHLSWSASLSISERRSSSDSVSSPKSTSSASKVVFEANMVRVVAPLNLLIVTSEHSSSYFNLGHTTPLIWFRPYSTTILILC